MASFRIDSPIASPSCNDSARFRIPNHPCGVILLGDPSFHNRFGPIALPNHQYYTRAHSGVGFGWPGHHTPTPEAPGALPWAAQPRSGCETRGPPTPGGAGPACGPLRAVIREYRTHWCIGGGCMVPRPSKSDPWVAPCVVLDGFSTLRLLWVAFRSKIEA